MWNIIILAKELSVHDSPLCPPLDMAAHQPGGERIRWRQCLVKGRERLLQALPLTWATHRPESELPAVLYSKTDTSNHYDSYLR